MIMRCVTRAAQTTHPLKSPCYPFVHAPSNSKLMTGYCRSSHESEQSAHGSEQMRLCVMPLPLLHKAQWPGPGADRSDHGWPSMRRVNKVCRGQAVSDQSCPSQGVDTHIIDGHLLREGGCGRGVARPAAPDGNVEDDVERPGTAARPC